MHEYPLIATVAAGLTAAWILGLLTQWLKLSPIVGYLLAGIAIGPHTPGFKGDLALAHQLAEIGVILLMFGVGLHFHVGDLIAVKAVAIPGAIGQSLVATVVCVAVFLAFGVEWKTGAVLGMAMAVASTVVLMRVLIDADALNSPAGHVAVGWLLVEDVLTVIVLVLIPVLGAKAVGETEATFWTHPVVAIAVALGKLAALVALVAVIGSRVIPWTLGQVARLRSRELFTLTVLVFSIAIAVGAYVVFGASMALGAFLAGMVVALSPVSHQAAADALPLRDAFAVLFFVSVGMLFDPMFLIREPLMMVAALGIILLVKPLIALTIVAVLGYSVRTALTVALGLAQIGEFSFILSDLAHKHGLMTEDGHSVLVGGAILSITLNPMLFRSIDRIEGWLKRQPRIWAMLNARAERRMGDENASTADELGHRPASSRRLAVVVGFGPVGRTVDRLLQDAGLSTVVIDMNLDTVAEIRRQERHAIYGDASREAILESAGIATASHLVLTLPQATHRVAIVAAARHLNPKIKIFVRARYLREREELEQVGATAAIFEEAEAAVALARLVLADTGAGRESIELAARDIRTRLILDNVSTLRGRTVRSIAVPWTRVRRLSTNSNLDDVRRQVGEQHFSRWPVVDGQTGSPVGYLLVKDLIAHQQDGTSWTTLVRPLGVVKPDEDIEGILSYFQRENATICLVQGNGMPLGIVTVEDILEQVIGRIEDEYPRHAKLVLRDVLFTDDELLDLQSTTWEAAIAEIAGRIPPSLRPANADVGALAIAREREMSTNLGFGVAVPHARIPGYGRPAVMFARSRSGIAFGGDANEPVHLVFLLVTSPSEPHSQVELLGQIATAISNPQLRQKLLECSHAGEATDLFRP